MRSLCAALLLFAFACSESTEAPVMMGTPDAGGVADPCTEATPCAVAPGTPQTEFIHPVRDEDTFVFDVASPGQVINVVVSNDADFSPVVYEVVLFGPDGASLDNRRGAVGRQRIVIQLVAVTAGQHRIVVRDVGGDDEDERNPYRVQVDLLSQTDDNEPNDVVAEATALTPGVTASGVIGSQGDEDWFRVSVGSNQLIEMTPSAPATGTARLSWTLYDPTGVTPLASSIQPGGDAAWPGQVRAVGNAAGDYLIVVRDETGQADLGRVYTLSVQLLPEPDVIDLAAPNETVETATPLTSGQTVNGYVAANADLDFYAIVVTGATLEQPKILTVRAEMAGLSPVDLSFTVLDRDGQTQVCDDRDEDLCKAFRREPDGSARRAELATAHPIFVDGTYYVRVNDLQNEDADQTVGYSLTVTVEDEPQANEDFDLSGRSGAMVIPTTTPTTGQTIQFAWVEGFISHANDQDWYQFDIPGPGDDLPPGHNGDWLIQLELQMPAPTPVELEAFFFAERRSYGGYGQRCRDDRDNPEPFPCQWPDDENGINGNFGEANGDCFVVFRERTQEGPHYFRMTDLDRDDFDLGAQYRFRVTITAQCPQDSVCMESQGLCGRP